MLEPTPRLGVALALVVLCCDDEAPPRPPPLEGAVRLEIAFPDLTFERPVDLQHAGDGTGRLFVVEQAGRIHAFENDPAVATTSVLLDITDRVSREGNEEGLLGLAFHPEFESRGTFYVYYSAASPRRGVLARFEVDPSAPDSARPDSGAVLLEIPQPYSNHNGGQVAFGPDGFLYLGLGDGGAAGDPEGNGQDPRTLLGAILRLDVDRPSAGRPYGIPADNPFAGNAEGFREEIYAWGLRNPWRFSWDPADGRLFVGDVGQDSLEEIDVVEKGKNYGWNVMEGSRCFRPATGCDRTGLEPPVLDYPRSDGISVTGGFVYRGPSVPALSGRYVYGDYGSGTVWAATIEGKRVTDVRTVAATRLAIASFGVDAEGELHACAFDGKIYRLFP